MHYSWGICTTPPNLGYWLQNYNAFVNAALPMTRNPDPDPEKAIAYEIGVSLALANDLSVDITAYYRDVRNGSTLDYSIYQDNVKTNTNFKLYSYTTNWGYRDSRGVELNFWRRSTSDRYFGIFGLSGNLSLAYSYDKTSVNGNSISQDSDFTTTLAYDDNTVDYNWDLVNFWPTYSRGYSDVKAKIALLWDFPYEVKLATMATYRSPWRYPKRLNVTNPRFEEILYGDSFFQADLRLTKYLSIGKHHGGVFIEVLNVLNRENILMFDNYGETNYYEKGLGPYGMFNRPTDQYGNPLTGIAREVYLGFEFSF
jgi:outer membrane receptor protein involved in Fe transport